MRTEALLELLQPGTDPDVAAAYASYGERARDAVFGFEDEIAFLDVETTGFDPGRDEIIEVAAVVAKGPEIRARFSTLVRPERPVPLEIAELTGIDDAMLADAPRVDEALAGVAELVGDRDVVAHNAIFDRTFTEAAGWKHPRGEAAWLDSLDLARIALPRMRSHRQTDLARAFGLLVEPVHRAVGDVETLARLWRVLLVALDDLPPGALAGVLGLFTGSGDSLARVLAHVAAARPQTSFDLKRLRQERLRAERPSTLKDAREAEIASLSVDEIAAEFDAAGAVGRMYADYERRAEQVEMARAVTEALNEGRHLAVEAGTGVGKSVAYLVPAARFALENSVPVGVATKTNALMDQLLYRELPALAREMPRLRYVGLKGYEHYLCLRKFRRLIGAGGPAEAEARAVAAMLVSWVASTSWGDLDAVNVHWRQDIRRAVAASAPECTKKRCPYNAVCYIHGQRRRARDAHVVVTNHSLLFRDAVSGNQILPPIRHWVVDEAHGAEAEAREQLSNAVSSSACTSSLSALSTRGRGGLLESVRAQLDAGDDARARADALIALVHEATTIAESFFSELKEIVVPGEYGREAERITARERAEGPWSRAAAVGWSLVKRLDRLLAEGAAVVTALEAAEDDSELKADLVGQLTALADAREALVLILEGDDERFVHVVRSERRGESVEVTVESLLYDVGEALAELFYPEVMSVIYTSATIAAGDDFSHFEHAVGLDRLPDGSYTTLRLASSYDFDRQMTVYVPTGIAPPRSSRYLEDLERVLFDVHVAMGGSVLTLFTNTKDMRTLYGTLAERLRSEGLRLIVQSRGTSAKRVADEFIADEQLSLFATKSFWEGFDAKGDTLRCVVVVRLPFAQPTDPLMEARKERERSVWWDRYYLPEAIIELKQAAGRLIRSSTDTGCLVLADSRLSTDVPYARRFLSALPVSDVERVPVERLRETIAARFGKGC
ncbi:exonuclease domain-containing protein [Coriobacteriia bacterium Es71-Z0120]|uniref:helicase C-terminal domain-containing protein n=1 Tax=Parvivirga hydrogeniphila TaxID=2939460 RepID=UPI0022608F8D|nr:helicase C-terminal domain-containing protein [Parvivirga hydrogeniphila]MCL4078166.1 exonuclease domain-containing protein [Parvivirga hydrogeniphila]